MVQINEDKSMSETNILELETRFLKYVWPIYNMHERFNQ